MKTYPEWLEEQNRTEMDSRKEHKAARLFAYTLVGIIDVVLIIVLAQMVGG